VRYDTRADERSDTYPSTSQQLVLLEALTAELRDLGVRDVDDGRARLRHGHGAGNEREKRSVPTIGFHRARRYLARDAGADVKPIVHAHYDGRDLVLPDDPTAVLTSRR
jgi:tripeptide aminopeptidase